MNYDGSYYYALGCVILTADEGRKPAAGQLGSVQIMPFTILEWQFRDTAA